VTPTEAAKEIETQLAAVSGWPVLVEPSSEIGGYATLRFATDSSPVHWLRYKPEMEPELSYLVAFQCAMALRTAEAKPENRFDVASTNALNKELPSLVSQHLKAHLPDFNESMVPQLAQHFANGLGMQIRTFPVTIRVERWISENYPTLHALQRRNNERHLKEAMAGLGSNIRAIAPAKVLHANLSMNAAFAKFLAKEWNEPHLAAGFVSAGYGNIADELLDLNSTIDASPNGDRQLVDSWAEKVGISNWYVTVPKT